MTVKIYGYGTVGQAMHTIFPDAELHDPPKGLQSTTDCDVALICVPTPLGAAGHLATTLVGEVIAAAPEPLLVIRSTVNPGDCDRWIVDHNVDICYMPEYLGETVAHPLRDETQRNFLVVGGAPEARRKVIDLFMAALNANTTIRQMSNYEAEVVKLSENRAIMFKVMQCQELADACERHGIDYYTIRDAVYGDDPRFNLWWTAIYEERGVNSKCLPKDVHAWDTWADEPAARSLTWALLHYNEEMRCR